MAVKKDRIKSGPKGAAKLRKEHRKAVVAEMYVTGKTFFDIGQKLGVSKVTIHKDMLENRQEWREARLNCTEQWTDEQLVKLDRLEAAAWDGWERSHGVHQKTTVETIQSDGDEDDGIRQKHTVVDNPIAGDARFLDVILRVIQRRCAILGIDAPEKIEDVTPRRPVLVEIETQEEAITFREFLDAQNPESENN